MTWLVFGVSCLLVLAGAVSIISGAPIIQLERGWAEVISGTVALASGGVVFALAGILMRLEAIRDTMAARSLPVTAESLPAAAPIRTPAPQAAPAFAEATAPTLPLAPPEPAIAPDASLKPDDGKTEGLWKRVKRPGSEPVPVPRADVEGLRQQGFPDRVVPDAAQPAAPTAAAPVVVPAHPVAAVTPPSEAAATEAAQDPAPADSDPGQIGWLERSLFKGRPARGGDAAPNRPEPSLPPLPFAVEPPAERAVRLDPQIAVDPQMPRPAPFAVPEPTVAAEPAPTPDLASEQHDGAAVVGRYQAGSASYVMYSDGTIEVETEGGEIHRFGSMDELKAFIAQQESTVS